MLSFGWAIAVNGSAKRRNKKSIFISHKGARLTVLTDDEGTNPTTARCHTEGARSAVTDALSIPKPPTPQRVGDVV
jgi:hypothetical protein